jgi:hypothetical protein
MRQIFKYNNTIKLWCIFYLFFLLSSCGAGIGDVDKELSGGYVFRLDGNTSYIISGNSHDYGIYPNVNSFVFDINFILVSQVPSEKLIVMFLGQVILNQYYYITYNEDLDSLLIEDYDLIKDDLTIDYNLFRLLSESISPNNTSQDKQICETIAQQIIDTSQYFQNMINNEESYWIINHKNGQKYGPLSNNSFSKKLIELEVPKGLIQEFNNFQKFNYKKQ